MNVKRGAKCTKHVEGGKRESERERDSALQTV